MPCSTGDFFAKENYSYQLILSSDSFAYIIIIIIQDLPRSVKGMDGCFPSALGRHRGWLNIYVLTSLTPNLSIVFIISWESPSIGLWTPCNQSFSHDQEPEVCSRFLVNSWERTRTLPPIFIFQVGPKKRNLKVKNFETFQFQPKILVANICKIYLHLGNDDRFCHAVSQDGRSYSHELFVQAEGVLCKIGQPVDEIAQLNELGTKIQVVTKHFWMVINK